MTADFQVAKAIAIPTREAHYRSTLSDTRIVVRRWAVDHIATNIASHWQLTTTHDCRTNEATSTFRFLREWKIGLEAIVLHKQRPSMEEHHHTYPC